MIKKYIFPIIIFLFPIFVGCTEDFLYEGDSDPLSTDNVLYTAVVSPTSEKTTRSENDLYEPLELHNDGDDFPIYLHTYEHPLGDDFVANEESQTRGLQVNNVQNLLDIHKSFDVIGNLEETGAPYFPMQNTKLVSTQNAANNIWTTERSQRWPGSDRIAFNAVAPHGHLDKLSNPVYRNNEISFSYTALKGDGTNDAEKQTDLLMATATRNRKETEPTNYRVPLHFNHALSAIKFAVRDVIAGKIISISIKGISGTANCIYKADADSKNGNFTWYDHSNKETYTQVFNHEIGTGNYDPTDESQDKLLTTDMPAKTFMVIPQVIPDDAEIEIEVERYNVAPHPAKIKVKGKIKANEVQEWKAGYEYVYTVSTSKDNWVYVFDAEGNAAEGIENIYVYSPQDTQFDTYGNTAYFNVKSYRYRANQQNYVEALPWKASHDGSLSYWVEGGNETAYPSTNPQLRWVSSSDWITDKFATPLSGKGIADKTAKEKHDLQFFAHYVTTDWVGDMTMQAYEPYSGFSESAPYDLSTYGGKRFRTTANCYVVDRGGWYMFPLVYGNAIKDGETNASAYTCQNTSTQADRRLLKVFTDCNNSPITNPYITVNNSARAELVWQDAYDMVDHVELVTIKGEKMIRFHVDSKTLQQGNALIALTDGSSTVGTSNIIWSWHIWATEHWLDKNTRLPHVYDTDNTTFNTYTASAAKSEDGRVIGLRQSGDVPVSYRQHDRTFMMSPYNLGWCDPKKVVYLKRKAEMKFVQYMPDGTTVTKLTDQLPIIQQGVTIDYKYANNTYYQFGRKDPMRGYFNHENDTKRVFGPRQPRIEAQGSISISESIKKPQVYFAGKGSSTDIALTDWLSNYGHSNLWNNHASSGITTIGNNDNDDITLWCHLKTVYDPCPAGYMVPNGGVWRFALRSGYNTQSGISSDLANFKTRLNGEYIDDYNLRLWGNGNTGNNNAIYFSSTGHRWWTDEWVVNGCIAGDNFNKTISYAWSNRYVVRYNNGVMNGQFGYCLAIGYDDTVTGSNPYYIATHFVARRIMARPVRAIREP